MGKNEKGKVLRYIDLFAGVGGFRLGIERAFNNRELLQKQKTKSNKDSTKSKSGQNRVTCVFASEIDNYAVKTYNKNFGENHEPNDITKVKADSIPDFDLLCGGFPCQSFSFAGKRKGFNDTRGTMFFEIARILKAKRPKYLLLENVKGLLNHDKGKTFRVIIQTLQELGYDIQWMVLNSKFFGVPQNRERVFIIGSARGISRPEILPFRESNRDIKQREDKGKSNTALSITASYSKRNARGTHIKTMIHNIYGGFGEKKVREFKEYSPTIRTPKGGGHLPMVKSSMVIRRLTPIECERLQGFPGDWTEGISDHQRYNQMGNAVTVNVVEAIIREMFK